MNKDKYLDIEEVKILRRETEMRALRDKTAKPPRVNGIRSWMIVDAALSLGLRVSELHSIRVCDIDLKRSFINIRRKKKVKNKKLPIKDTLAISPEFAEHLKDYLAGRKTGRLFSTNGKSISIQGIQASWLTAVRRAGLPHYSIHCARRSMGFHLLAKTKNLKQVQKQLGHTNVNTTAQMYCDVSFEEMQEGVTGLYE